MKIARILSIFAMLASLNVYGHYNDDAPLFQNDPCHNWAMRTDGLFNSEQSDEMRHECPDALFQNDPCHGWWSTTESLFN